jgi:hypothetical protein
VTLRDQTRVGQAGAIVMAVALLALAVAPGAAPIPESEIAGFAFAGAAVMLTDYYHVGIRQPHAASES